MGPAWWAWTPRREPPLTSALGSSLPGHALIELVRWCGLGLGVEAVASGRRHVPERRAPGRGDDRWAYRFAEMGEDRANGGGFGPSTGGSCR